jgi:immune inhibitor A
LVVVVSTLLLVGVAIGATGPAGAVQRLTPRGVARGHREHAMPDFVQKWRASKVAAADAVATGAARIMADGRVRLDNGEFVDYEQEGEDHVVTLLAQFTDPVRGQIPKPDPALDNTSYWLPHFTRQHYQDMLFSEGGGSYAYPSMNDFYQQQSSGRYGVTGQVSKWLAIDHPESEYGANDPATGAGGDDLNGPVYRVVRDALRATRGVDEGIDWSPSIVDTYDRYDCDGDGNFNEPDGYVDHFELIHAGMGEEVDGGAQGSDAIWSHSWYAGQGGIGKVGPAGCHLGGYHVPGTDLWVADYTTEPEDGAVGVFAHEFGHDLGLPDLYDTAGGDNSTSFWTIMSSGSYGADPEDPLETKPTHEGAWEKMVLGFLADQDVKTMDPGESGTIRLGPAEGATIGNKQVLRVNLPDYQAAAPAFPADDGPYYYSNTGDNVDNYQVRSLNAPLASDTTLTFRANLDTEEDWDYAYVIYSTDGFDTVHYAETSLSTDTNPNGQNFGNGMTGSTGGWVDATATLPAGTDSFGFEYWTDSAFHGLGLGVDSISVGGGPVDTADDPSPWTQQGFGVAGDGQIINSYFHYYLVESRSYKRNDSSLCGVPHFTIANLAERICFADGVLVWYRDGRFADNDVILHPGHGQILPVDAHPTVIYRPHKHKAWSPTYQSWDSTFGTRSHTITLHVANHAGKLFGDSYFAPARPVFDDSVPGAYWRKKAPLSSVITPGSGLRIEILDVSPDGGTYRLKISWH